MKDVTLPSGSTLKILSIPFSEAKALYQALLEEAKGIAFDAKTDLGSLMKQVFCVGFSSKKVDAALSVCLSRCTYNDLKIDASTFEPLKAREDYSIVCIEVVQDTIAPFTKGLYAEFARLLSTIESAQK